MPEDKTSFFVLSLFPTKRDYGETFGVGLAKMSRSINYWLLFFNQGFYTKTDWVPPTILNRKGKIEVVFVMDRKNGTFMIWVKGTDCI